MAGLVKVVQRLCSFLLHVTRADAEGCIQRTETNEAGEHKNATKNNQYETQRAGHRAREVQYSKDGGQNYPDHAVNISHVLFHSFFRVMNGLTQIASAHAR